MDTALFVLAAALLHGFVGTGTVYLFHLGAWLNGGCDVWGSLARLIWPVAFPLPSVSRCSIHTGIGLGLVEFLIVLIVAFYAGRYASRFVMRRVGLAESLYGSYYERRSSDDDPIVIANVMTDVECDGRILMYEGQLVELALSSSRAVKYVCILSPRRFLMTISEDETSTTNRSKFIPIDREGQNPSRLTINGENIKNILTRTHYLKASSFPTNSKAAKPHREMSLGRRSLLLCRWLRRRITARSN